MYIPTRILYPSIDIARKAGIWPRPRYIWSGETSVKAEPHFLWITLMALPSKLQEGRNLDKAKIFSVW